MILLEATSGIEPVALKSTLDPSLESEDFSEIASSISICDYLIIWSEREDLNLRPLVSQTRQADLASAVKSVQQYYSP
jgi:hypothetical protein